MEVKDVGKIMTLVATVATIFSLNNRQLTELKQFAQNNMYTWIAERRREEEVEEMLRAEARIISD